MNNGDLNQGKYENGVNTNILKKNSSYDDRLHSSVNNIEQNNNFNLDLEEILLISYLRQDDETFECIITNKCIMIYKKQKLLCTEDIKEFSVEVSVKCFVYSTANVILTIHTNCIKLWKFQNLKLLNTYTYSALEDFSTYDFRVQKILDNNNFIKRTVLVGFNDDSLVKLFQITVSDKMPRIIFQQNILLEEPIKNLEIFPTSKTDEPVSYFIAETSNKMHLFTVDMSYIKDVAKYLSDKDMILYVESLKINTTKIAINKPTSFSKLNSLEIATEIKQQRNFIINEYEIKMGNYYYNLLNLFKGDLPEIIDQNYKIPFTKFSNLQLLDSVSQEFFLECLDMSSEYTNCCLVHHSHCLVAIMCYSKFFTTEKKPRFFNLTCIKDLQSIIVYSNFVDETIGTLISTSCKIRNGQLGNSASLKLSLPEYSFNADENEKYFKTYLNMHKLSLIYTFLPMEINGFSLIHGNLPLIEDHVFLKRQKVVSTSKKNYNYTFYNLNEKCDKNTIVISNIVSGDTSKRSSFFQYCNSLNGLLFIEYDIEHKKGLSIKKLFFNKYNQLKTTSLVKIKDTFGDKEESFDINFFKDIVYSDYTSGVISYTKNSGRNILQFFNIQNGKLENKCVVELDANFYSEGQYGQYKKLTKEKNGIEFISIGTEENAADSFVAKNSLFKIFISKCFNPDFKVVWMLTNESIQIVVRFLNSKNVEFSHVKKSLEVDIDHWRNSKRWSISTDGNTMIFLDDNNLYKYSLKGISWLEKGQNFLKIDLQKSLTNIEQNERIILFTKNIDIDFTKNIILVFAKSINKSHVDFSVLSYDLFNKTFKESKKTVLDVNVLDMLSFNICDVIMLNEKSKNIQNTNPIELKILMTYEQRRNMDKSIIRFNIIYTD
ncbi:hypothetical protein QEN19_003215 [Hanseniaspora menglaensis]